MLTPHISHVDASDIGLPPGFFPETLDDDGEPYRKVMDIRTYTGNEESDDGFVYTNEDGSVVMYVYND